MRPFRECFRALLRSSAPDRWRLFLLCLLGIVQVGASLAFVWLSKRAVDIATGLSDWPLGRGVGLLAAVMLLQVLVRVAFNYCEGYVEVHSRNRMRADVFARVMRSVWNGRDAFHSGDTVNRLEEDIRVVTDFVVCTIPQVIVTLCQLVAATIFLFALSPGLGWILLFIMPAAAIGSRLFFRKMRSLTMDIRDADSRVQSHLQENIQHRVVVRSLGSTENVLDRLDDIQDEVMEKTVTRLNYSAVSRAFLQFGFMAGYAVAFIWSVKGLYDKSVTYGMMTAFLQLVGQVQRPVADIARQIPGFIRALASQDRLLSLSGLEQEESVQDRLFESAPGIRLKDLGFTYEGASEPVFSHLDFDFLPGSMTSITGATGEGKSTLVKVIMSLLKPSEGEVSLYSSVDGEQAASGPATLCNFMYVPQGNSLMSGTVRQNLLLAKPDASEEELWEGLDIAMAGFVRSLEHGLDSVCAEVGAGLSEGQAQRIAIARALLRPGGVLILDEATSALDEETEAALLENLASRYSGQKTILCITHRPAATRYAQLQLRLGK